MKHPDEEIEALLARLNPAPPDPAFMARLRAAKPELPAGAPQRSRKILYLWAPLAAAAGISLALIPRDAAVAQPVVPAVATNNHPASAEPQPVGSLQHLMDVADLGIVQDENDMPVRLIRTRWIDEIVYEDPEGGTPVKKEGRLREEVLPVSLPYY